MIRYQIHSIAQVRAADELKAHVRASLEFQLGHFRSKGPEEHADSAPIIRFEPYEKFTGAPATHFHQVRGEAGRFLHAPGSRYAVVVNGGGFDVFTDTTETLVNILLQILALRQGLSFIHAAGWVDAGGRATLVPGPGGVGKTALLSAGVLRHNVKLLGDDLVIAGKAGQACSFPRAFVLKPYHRSQFPAHFPAGSTARRSFIGPLLRFAQENIPFRGVLKSAVRQLGHLEATSLWMQQGITGPDLHPVRVADLFGSDRVAKGGTVARVIYLERADRSDFSTSGISVEEVVARSVAVLQHEWVDYGRWFTQMGALRVFSMPEYFNTVERSMRAACESAERWLVQVPEGATPLDLESWFARELGFAATTC